MKTAFVRHWCDGCLKEVTTEEHGEGDNYYCECCQSNPPVDAPSVPQNCEERKPEGVGGDEVKHEVVGDV